MIEAARARALARLGRIPEAAAAARRAVQVADSTLLRKPSDLERRGLSADAHLALGEVLSGSGAASGAGDEWGRALAAVDSVAHATSLTDLLALDATALLHGGNVQAARAPVGELMRRGYRRPSFVALARGAGIGGGP
jgi:hypothetical protein